MDKKTQITAFIIFRTGVNVQSAAKECNTPRPTVREPVYVSHWPVRGYLYKAAMEMPYSWKHYTEKAVSHTCVHAKSLTG